MFGVKDKKLSQEALMLKELRKAGSKGILNYQFPKMRILSYTKIISNLREEGWNIVKDRMYVDGKATGVYRYVLVEEV